MLDNKPCQFALQLVLHTRQSHGAKVYRYWQCLCMSKSLEERRPMSAAILNFCFVITRKLLFLSAPPLAHNLLYFRKATGALRGGQYPVLCFVLCFFLKIR